MTPSNIVCANGLLCIGVRLIRSSNAKVLALIFTSAISLYSSGVGAEEAESARSLLRCGAIVDVVDRRILGESAILVVGGVIREIRPWDEHRHISGDVIDLSRKFCLPGLMDMHEHLSWDLAKNSVLKTAMTQSSAAEALLSLHNAQVLLHNGFTTIRIVGENDRQFSSVDLRNALDGGTFEGPRMLVAQHIYSETGGSADLNEIQAGWPEVGGQVVHAGVENVRETVRYEKKHGADWIKICATGGVMTIGDDPDIQGFTDSEIAAFADEAHRLGMKIAAHVHGNRGALAVAKAGFDSIEHGTMIEDDAIAMMKKNNVTLVPTRYVLEWILMHGVKGGVEPENYAKALAVAKHSKDSLMKAYRAGVRIAVGSDPIFPHDEANREFAALVRAGIPAWDSVRGGTIVAAELLGLQTHIGSINVGKDADIVAVNGNPVSDISELERVQFVMKGGKVVRNSTDQHN